MEEEKSTRENHEPREEGRGSDLKYPPGVKPLFGRLSLDWNGAVAAWRVEGGAWNG